MTSVVQPEVEKSSNPPTSDVSVRYESFTSPSQIEHIVTLIENDLSEPYSIYTYRCFIYQWPDLCKLVCCPPSPEFSSGDDGYLVQFFT